MIYFYTFEKSYLNSPTFNSSIDSVQMVQRQWNGIHNQLQSTARRPPLIIVTVIFIFKILIIVCPVSQEDGGVPDARGRLTLLPGLSLPGHKHSGSVEALFTTCLKMDIAEIIQITLDDSPDEYLKDMLIFPSPCIWDPRSMTHVQYFSGKYIFRLLHGSQKNVGVLYKGRVKLAERVGVPVTSERKLSGVPLPHPPLHIVHPVV